MKGLRIPKINEVERKEGWDNLKDGDALLEVSYDMWSGSYRTIIRTVIKKTPKGFVRLDNGVLLKSLEDEYFVITKEVEEFHIKANLDYEMSSLLVNILQNKEKFQKNLTYEDALKLKEIINKTMVD